MAFFNLDSLSTKKDKKVVKKKIDGGCDTCPLHCGRFDLSFTGDGKDGVMVIADAPVTGEDNDENVFVSGHYDELFALEGKRGMPESILESSWLGYCVPAQLPKDKGESLYKCCQKRLLRIVAELKPKVIICLGIWPTQLLIGSRLSGRMTGMKATDFFGKCIPDREYNCWICPTYHPKMLTWTDYRDDRAVKTYFQGHIRTAYRMAAEPLPAIPDNWEVIMDPRFAAKALDGIMARAEKGPDGKVDVAIDYEATGLKPHRKGHRIVVSSVAWREGGEYHAVGFKWDGECQELVDAWYRLTHSDRVGLVAHNLNYEACWTRFRAGIHNGRTDWATNWSWDTCVAAHCIDNTQKVGLKFQTYCELGVLGYDADADSYLKGDDADPVYGESKNAFNGLAKDLWVPWEKICEYCAKDSLYTLVLRDLQDDRLLKGQRESYKMMLSWAVGLAEVQSEGLPVDIEALEKTSQELEERKQEAYREVMSSDEVKAWNKVHPDQEFNPDSNVQLKELLYTILKYKAPNETQDCTKDTLDKMGTPMCRAILTMRTWAKTKDTFIADYRREAVWDDERQCYLIRPFFNIATGASGDSGGPRTYRTSCDSPNLQNVPKRDKQMKKLLRTLFVAPEGYRFMECDYRSLEVYISEAYHRDPNMEMYLMNPDANMHTDTACDFYHRTKDTLTKEERNTIKAGYVFASFYGASYRSCAQYMWNNMPKYTKEHLQNECGIKTYDQWVEQVRKADDIFWNKRFRVYNEWRKEQWRLYQKQGYLDTFLGFRLQGPMTMMQTGNSAIQGTGAHCLLYGMVKNLEDFRANGLKSRIVGEIHDSQVILVKEEEINQVCEIVWKNSVKACQDAFPWLNLPLVVETDLSDRSRSWAHMNEIGVVSESGCPGLQDYLKTEEA